MTDTQLESRRYRRVFHGVWMPTELEDSRELRLEAAKLGLPDRGVLWGLTAAWIYGADVRRLDDLDVHAGFPKGRRVRKQSGLVVCQETLDPSDIARIDGVQVTTPLRTGAGRPRGPRCLLRQQETSSEPAHRRAPPRADRAAH